MKARYFLLVSGTLLLLTSALPAQQAMPAMKSCDPGYAKIGDVVTVTGENLDKSNVDKVYLTDDKDDFVMEVQEQAAGSIKVKVPAKVKMGRLAFMLLTRGKEPKLIVQPVKLTLSETGQPPADQLPPPEPAPQPEPAKPEAPKP